MGMESQNNKDFFHQVVPLPKVSSELTSRCFSRYSTFIFFVSPVSCHLRAVFKMELNKSDTCWNLSRGRASFTSEMASKSFLAPHSIMPVSHQGRQLAH